MEKFNACGRTLRRKSAKRLAQWLRVENVPPIRVGEASKRSKIKVAFELINELFRIERKDIGKDAADDVRLKVRQEKSLKIVDDLKRWADETAPSLPLKTLSGKAVRYMLERWEKLTLFLNDPILRLDTNPVEGVIRAFVVGRNNWMLPTR